MTQHEDLAKPPLHIQTRRLDLNTEVVRLHVVERPATAEELVMLERAMGELL
jgi:hypothetical protein